MAVELSKVAVDFETLLSELKADLASKGTWKDLLISSTGTALLEYVTAIGVFNQYNIEMAFREAFSQKAIRDSSLYGIAETLGVDVPRKMPSIYEVLVSNVGQNDVFIKPKTKFIVNGAALYNTVQINIAPEQEATYYLKEGLAKEKTFEITSEKYQTYTLNEPGFIVVDDDVTVVLRDNLTGSEEAWTKADSALWMYGQYDKIYFEKTTAEGDVSIFFGDGVYGTLPSVNSTLVVRYTVTTGTVAANMLGSKIVCDTSADVDGKVISCYQSGIVEKPSMYYKLYASHMYKARNRAVTKTDYISIILGHRDVAGVTVSAQRDLYPNDPKWMNTVRICILAAGTMDTFGGSNPNPTSVKWTDFLEWLQPKIGWIKIQTWNPIREDVDVTVKIALKQEADDKLIKEQAENNIQTLFNKDMYSLGKAIYISDITRACTVPGVDYVNVISPETNRKPADNYTYLALNKLDVSVFYSERTSLPTYQL